MKSKLFVAMTTLLSLGLFASTVWACPGCGYHGGWSGNANYRGNTAPNYQQFNNETAQLRKELVAKQGEYKALMNQANSNPNKAAQLRREINRLHSQIHSQAQAYNMPARQGAYNNRPYNHNWGYCGGWNW